jgi:hypothetical protein
MKAADTRSASDFVIAMEDNARGTMPMKAHFVPALLDLTLLAWPRDREVSFTVSN